MAMLPESMRTSAAYLGGGIARGLQQKGSQLVGMGQQLASAGSSAPIKEKVGQFLQSVGQPVQSFAGTVGAKGGMTKRDLGLIAQGAGLSGAFVGGMGATQGMNALANFFAQDTLSRRSEVGAVGSSPMPQDLQTGYISLNQFGSPLGVMNVRNTGNVREAQLNQRAMRNQELSARLATAATVGAGAGMLGASPLLGGVIGTMVAERGMKR